MKKVVVIVGPTASGKTNLSIVLAKHFKGEIISGDSVQVYRGLDIGSAKIKSSEMQGIKHHLIDIINTEKRYSTYDFQKDVREKIAEINFPIIVGGTGLYIKSALYNYEFDEDERSDLFEKKYVSYSTTELYQKLMILDPNNKVDYQNRRRVLRALEQAESGYLRSNKNKKDEPLYDILTIYLDIDRTILEQRLRVRLEQQIKDGFIAEVQKLYENKNFINAIGYRELYYYIKGDISLDEAKEEIIKKSKLLAKKQKTWFKNQMHSIVLNALDENLIAQAIDVVETFLKE